MSLPGVESARRRRTSHGRSSVGFLQPPPLCRRSTPHPTTASFNHPLPCLEPGDQYQKFLNDRAMEARHRLDERLRNPTPWCTPHTDRRRHIPPPVSRPLSQPRTSEKLHRRSCLIVMNEEELAPGGQQHDDCPVCLDSFSSGQMVTYLPCQHSFHSDCIVPWLQIHSHCPSCRAKIV